MLVLVVSMRVVVYLCVCVCRVYEGDVYFVVSVGGVCVCRCVSCRSQRYLRVGVCRVWERNVYFVF